MGNNLVECNLRVGIKVGWPSLKVPNIMVWGCKFPTLNLK